jgi:hypothetical protein
VPLPVATWVASGGLLRLHASALQQLPASMASLPAAAISSSVDFGVRQLPSAAKLAQLGASPGEPPPGLCFFRELRVANTGHSLLRLLNICAYPGASTWLGLADDHQVARPAEQLALMLRAAGAAAGDAAADGSGPAADLGSSGASAAAAALRAAAAALAACHCRVLELRPGQEANVTVALDLHAHLAAGPDAEMGILQQLLLFTLLLPAELLPAASSSSPGPPPPHTPVPGTGEVAVVLSRLVTAVLVAPGGAADLQSCLRVEARPFVSAALRGLFNARPASFTGCMSPLGAIFGAPLLPQPAAAASVPCCRRRLHTVPRGSSLGIAVCRLLHRSLALPPFSPLIPLPMGFPPYGGSLHMEGRSQSAPTMGCAQLCRATAWHGPIASAQKAPSASADRAPHTHPPRTRTAANAPPPPLPRPPLPAAHRPA